MPSASPTVAFAGAKVSLTVDRSGGGSGFFGDEQAASDAAPSATISRWRRASRMRR